MRRGTLLVILWLAIGAAAAGQRGYFGATTTTCSNVGTVVITMTFGPLNYVGLDPKLLCKLPSPSG